MELNIKDNKGALVKLGEKVRILFIQDDSGRAIDIYGVEPQLDGWVEQVYIEPLEGIVTFDESLMTIMVVSDKGRKVPLSKKLRSYSVIERFERLDHVEESKIMNDDFGLEEITEEIILNYLVKL